MRERINPFTQFHSIGEVISRVRKCPLHVLSHLLIEAFEEGKIHKIGGKEKLMNVKVTNVHLNSLLPIFTSLSANGKNSLGVDTYSAPKDKKTRREKGCPV